MSNYFLKIASLFVLSIMVTCFTNKAICETGKELYETAITFGKEGQFSTAIMLLQDASKIEPQNKTITISLAIAVDCSEGKLSKDTGKKIFESIDAGNKGDWTNALILAQKACDLSPNNSLAYVHLGTVHSRMVLAGNKKSSIDADHAINAFRSALVIDPKNGLAHYNIGPAYAAQQKWTFAKAHLSEAASLKIIVPNDIMERVEKEYEKNIKYEAEKETKKEKRQIVERKTEQTRDSNIISSLWPFGPNGWICKHIYPSAYTDTEKRFWNAIGGCRCNR